MILQLPFVIKQGCLPYDPTIKFYSWIFAIIYTAVIGFLFFIKMLRISKENKSQKEMFRSIGLFFYFYIGVRVCFLFSDFERNLHCESIAYFQFVFLAYIFGVSAFLSIVNFGEKYIITRTKKKITYMIIICIIVDAVIIIFLPTIVNLSNQQFNWTLKQTATYIRYFNYGIQYFTGGIIFLIYLYLIVKSTGRIRRNSIITVVGLGIAVIASFLEIDVLLSTGIMPPYLSPIIFCIGITVFAFAYLRTLK